MRRTARAHQQTTTFAEIAYPVGDGDVGWRIRFRAADLVRIAPAGHAADAVAAGLRVAATLNGSTRPCPRVAASVAPDPNAPEPTSVFVARFACGPGAKTLHLRYDLMFDHDPYHASYARVDVGQPQGGDDPDASTAVFYDRQREVAIDVHQPPPAWRTAAIYVRLGVAHILTGADHLAFLAALLLAAAVRGRRPAHAASAGESIRSAAAIVSAFTVAHSITLATQVLRPGTVPTRWVEPAIAFSVAVVAIENLLPRPPARAGRWCSRSAWCTGWGSRRRCARSACRGAGWSLALVSFNVGVELGQLLVVGLALPLLVAAARRNAARYERWGLRAASAVLAAAALVAFFSRLPR